MLKKRSILNFQIFSAIFSIAIGSLLHFTFDWSNNSPLVGTFSAVNESTWEHLKILFVPMLITAIIGYFYTKPLTKNYLCAKTKGIIIALLFIVIAFYTYSGVLGKNIDFINIIIFFIAAIIGEYFTYKKISTNKNCNNLVPIIFLIILSFCFILFTFKTPEIGIFKDPVNKTYGING